MAEGSAPAAAGGVDMPTHRFPDGGVYRGGCASVSGGAIVREGEGALTDVTGGALFDGSWSEDRMQGEGQIALPGGATYKGGFRANKFEGRGVYTWPSGASLDAVWRDSKPVEQLVFRDYRGDSWIPRGAEDVTPSAVQLTPQVKLVHPSTSSPEQG